MIVYMIFIKGSLELLTSRAFTSAAQAADFISSDEYNYLYEVRPVTVEELI